MEQILISSRRMRNNTKKTLPFILSLALFLVTIPNTNSNALSIEDTPTTNSSSSVVVKGGRCPEAKMDPRLCLSEGGDQCTDDAQCSGESRCCSTGCARVCVIPVYTACETVRTFAERRARSLSPEDAASVHLPDCDPNTGIFQAVQCSSQQSANNKGSDSKSCFCVDELGFEIPGTRARTLEGVNCSRRNPMCEGPTCRMLCPHGFALDSNGCEICECRNVCSNVKCPSGLECEVVDPPCTSTSCPPTPSCKQPRSLDSLCPFGAPLTIPELGTPFLCGSSASGPPCPAAFQCNVGAGNDYGVCCAANKNFDKPGTCPVIGIGGGSKEENCAGGCRHDLDCPDFDKCCFTQGCGKQCSKPANSTACLQQRHIAELLSGRELEGKGYIPQCDETGNFIPKQCSRNGKVCWCVGADGKNFAQSLGSADSVNCSNISFSIRQRAALRSDDSSYSSPSCDPIICPPTLHCEFGFKTDRNSCPSCDCMESPCAHLRCPSGSGCVLIPSSSSSASSALEPTCLSDSLFVNPCPLGSPLTHGISGQVVACSQSAPTCPSSHICVLVAPNKAGTCCPNTPRLEPTKPGMCPFLASTLCSRNVQSSNNNSLIEDSMSHKKCGTDGDCENSMKCCAAGDCTVCADPLLHQDIQMNKEGLNSSPSMCQYLRDVEAHVEGSPLLGKFRLAKGKPQCTESGEFSPVQCDLDSCMCVDEHGAEIMTTRADKLTHTLTTKSCLDARMPSPACLEMNCRLECDYGFESLDGCKICECRNPCSSNHSCGTDEFCEMVDIDCPSEHCPPLPFCIPKVLASLASGNDMGVVLPTSPCPNGPPFRSPLSNDTLSCSPRARMLQCPDDYFCSEVMGSNGGDTGICCPILDEEQDAKLDEYLSVENRAGDGDDVDTDNLFQLLFPDSVGSGSGHQHDTKPGQCPYLLPFHAESERGCESECETDSHCSGGLKCCLNSCGGSQCATPLLLTACQHQKEILEHKARESGLPSRHIFIPECSLSGEYVRIQSFSGRNWCVDSAGEEIQGTRVPLPNRPNCQRPSMCPQTRCDLQCEFGLNLDSAGCPICACRPSPCDQVACSKGEECRIMQLNCISEPCKPVALCLPRLDNPCPFGSPLSFEESGDRVPCGKSNACPSSHKCNISPFGEYAVCCPKPKEVCFEQREEGRCKSTHGTLNTKWFFNTTSNECQPFSFSGCGNNNNFNSKAECLSVCPALSHCERTRSKNSELVGKYNHMSYIPKCDPRTGDWESVQCLEEVGMCWCVDKKKGTPLKGTMTNGVPNCQPRRRGRGMQLDDKDTSSTSSVASPLLCKAGITVHKCSKDTCSSKVCLAHPNAVCMVNPCGGCIPKWISPITGQKVDCFSNLGSCHRELQTVINSQAWINQGFSPAMALLPPKPEVDQHETENLMGSGGGSHFLGPLTELLLRGAASTRHHQGPTIFATSLGGHGMMGIMSSSLTFIGDSSEEDANNKQNSQKKNLRTPYSPVKSIADILADLMTSGSSHNGQHDPPHHPSPGYLSDDVADLMPSSSGGEVSRRQSRLLPHPEHFRMRVRRDLDQILEDSLAMESTYSSSSSSSSEEMGGPNRREILVSILPPPPHMNDYDRGSVNAKCPPPSPFALLSLLSGSCGDECEGDGDCPTGLKCCLSGCGLRCIRLNGDGGGGLSSMSTLVNPVYEAIDLEPPTMVVSLPECDSRGGYSPVQSQEDLSWCVSPDGAPISETLTRGKVICSTNGTLLQRWMKGPICPDSEQQQPSIPCSKDACLSTSCPLHPDAVCVMDVCSGCHPSFYKPSGEKVQCESPCSQPSFDPGLCRASIPRYSFNATSLRCEPFNYGGCAGSSNNFHTLEECSSQCVTHTSSHNDICNLPAKPGPCRASMVRYHYNHQTGCTPFDYGGCGGNANNFMKKEYCEARCPDIVLCPKLEADGLISTCSRMEACRNVTCPGDNLDDFICTVDPCTCTATLTDFHGHQVNCSNLQMSSLPSPHIETGDSEVIDAPNSVFAGQYLKLIPGIPIPTKTRCELIKQRDPQHGQDGPYCDLNGSFIPRQCPSSSPCFCVDASGKIVENADTTNSCEYTPISQVLVSLSLPGGEDISPVQLGVEMQQLLHVLGAEVADNRIEVEVLPDSILLNFRLIGENPNCADISFWLESFIITNSIGVENAGVFHPADFSASSFIHERATKVNTTSTTTTTTTFPPTTTLSEEEPDSVNEIDDTISDLDTIAAQRLLESGDNTVGILLTLVAAITACLIVLGLFLSNQKKKGAVDGGVGSGGLWHKKAFGGLGAFSSGLYEVEKDKKKDKKKKMLPWREAVTIPTFRVTPFVTPTPPSPSTKT